VLMFTLAPSTRFGYYIYPLGLWIWLAVARPDRPVAGPDRSLAGAGPPVTGADRRPSRIPLCR
jgi:hypothetical protein